MTRVTDFGRKRAHVEATFNYNEADLDVVTSTQGVEIAGDVPGADGQPPKKKRKRGPRKKAGTDVAAGAGDDGESGEKGEVEGEGEGKNVNGKKGKKRKAKSRTLQERKEVSEKRRRRRMAERNADTICFACREKGHAVQDCPKIADGSIKPPEMQSGFGAPKVVGICYRCGSRKHRLSACRATVSDPSNPLPFASCFVCNENGHLASRCPKNKGKGVYPNGGSCKLCGETDHLARDCKLGDRGVPTRPASSLTGIDEVNPAASKETTFMGTGAEAGADEDDFHALKRKSAQVNKETAQKPSHKNQEQKRVVNF